MGCGSSSPGSNDGHTDGLEDGSLALEDMRRVDIRENSSVSQILHYPDDNQQLSMLQQMRQDLSGQLDEQNEDPGRFKAFVDPLDRPSSSDDILKSQLRFCDELLRLVQLHQQELRQRKKGAPSTELKGSATKAQIPPLQKQQSTVTSSDGQSEKRVYPKPRISIQSMEGNYVEKKKGAPREGVADNPGDANLHPTNSPSVLGENVWKPPEEQADEYDVAALGPRRDAYHSGVNEDDSNALARLLKKHFNNFILECEFNASGNSRAFDIIRARRCDRLEIDNSLSTAHNLTVERTKHIADMFLRYSMAVIDSQRWGGELRYAIKRPNPVETYGSLSVVGNISYVTSDRTMKFDAPYQVEIIITLQLDEEKKKKKKKRKKEA